MNEHKRMAKVLTNDLRHLYEHECARLLTLNHERDNNRDDRNRLN
jgi:hypothetical protein